MIRPYYYQGQRDSQSGEPSYQFGSRLTPAIRWIIFACALVFLVQVVLSSRSRAAYDGFQSLFAFEPRLAIGHFRVWQFVSYMFLHASFWHIFINLLSLWMIGGLVERRLGTRKFTWLYLLSGVAGAAAQGIFFRDVPTIGASAGVMGVTAACALLYPDLTILAMMIVPMKMKHFVWIIIAMQLLGVSSAAPSGNVGVAYFAHLAGLAAGYLFVKLHMRAGAWLNGVYYRARGQFRGFVGQGKVTHIDDDEKYREEVDRLLDKIFREGTQSLSAKESEFLRNQSEKYKKES